MKLSLLTPDIIEGVYVSVCGLVTFKRRGWFENDFLKLKVGLIDMVLALFHKRLANLDTL